MKKILGLDLGTNSIGWAMVEEDFDSKQGKIWGMGSRIIPMSQDILGKFDAGNSISQTAERTGYRGHRRLYERCNLRRERLHRVLNILGFLPEHYAKDIDFVNNLGKFIPETKTKLPWVKDEEGRFKFLFQTSFNEMLNDFKANGQEIKIPYDWTIYYLRKKALTHKILKEELAWIILNFNTKRGYYQLRGEEEEEMTNKSVEFHSLKITDVVADEKPNSKGETWYSLYLENGWIYRRSSKNPLYDWKDKVRDFIVTTDLNDDGTIKTDKDGNEKRSFRAPNENDWTLLKKKTEADIEHSHKTVGTFIYETLLQNPTQKIRGKLVRTIERTFYKEELLAILKKQIELQPELFTEEKYCDCVRELYCNNTEQQSFLSNQDFVHLFVNDIIFYQRPLRSQKSSIGNCSLEFRIHKDKNNNTIKEYLKGIPKSNPYYQEFRLWQWLYNLKIYNKDNETEVTTMFITNIEDLENLFDFLNNRKDIEQNILIKYLLKQKDIKGKNETDKYRWNYVEDKKYPCNETHSMLSTRLTKVENVPDNFLEIIDTKEFIDRKTEEHGIANLGTREYQLWHIIYSVTDKKEYEQALRNFAIKYNLETEFFVENFKKFPPFKSEYGSYSEKAIKKLLPLMRIGKYWKYAAIDEKTKIRISKIITGEYDEKIKERVREKAINLTNEQHFQGLQLWLAQYIVYDRHSEAEIAGKWKNVADLEEYLNEFKQHSLRNPIVEQVITETLRVVRDIWKQYGHSRENFFDEIHIELGREMKNTSEERKKISNTVIENENTNLRIKALLAELQNDSNVENVRPYSPVQQEILKIYEEYAVSNIADSDNDKDFILKISKTAQPSSADLQHYKLWLEQRYRSPYTGQIIPLGKLFTSAYEIEHIIPQSRYFDNSLSNKVICEAAVNKKKDRELGLEFIKNHHGEIIETGLGQSVKILEETEYIEFVNRHYSKNRPKKTKLLLEEIPDKMIERQMNDARYISKFISSLLSNIVRTDSNDDGINSKNVLPVNGKITTILKQDWGLNDIWNDLILSRFERMNQLTETNKFTAWNEQHQKFLPTVPLELSKGFQKKRIDHRHHAMDALVIACVTRDHINLLNNQSAKSEKSRYDLQHKLRYTEKWIDKDGKERYKFSEFKKPWNSFTVEAKNELSKIIISFKQNLRIINKATNKYCKYKDGKKITVKQEGLNWAIRKPLHKETVYAQVSLRKTKTVRFSEAMKNWKSIVDKKLKKEIERIISLYGDNYNTDTINKYFKDRKYKFQDVDVSKVDVYYFNNGYSAARESLNTSFNENKIKDSVTDTAIHRILLNYLSTKENNPDLAFSPERIYKMVSSTGNQCMFVRQDISTPIVNKIEFSPLNKMERAITGEMIKDVCIKLMVDRLGNIKAIKSL